MTFIVKVVQYVLNQVPVGIHPLVVSIQRFMLTIRQKRLGRILVARLQAVYMVQAVGKYLMQILESIVAILKMYPVLLTTQG